MKRVLFATALLLAPAAGWAQDTKPELVLIPRDVAAAALNWIATPDPTMAVRLYSALQSCIKDNPNKGVLTRSGEDQCQDVTAAIEARAKEIADLQKQLADAQKAKPQEPRP